jgi:chromosome segregation ATPase
LHPIKLKITTMKKILFFSLLVFLFACNNENKEESGDASLDSLKSENAALKEQAAQKDEIINEFLTSFDEIQENLSIIKEKESVIALQTEGDVELEQSAKDKINEDIQTIYELMIDNKKKLNNLQSKLKSANLNIGKLESMVKELQTIIEQKTTQIDNMQDQLAHMDIVVEKLSTELANITEISTAQEEKIGEQTQEINTAYYVYGTDKELKANGVITKEGGFIGIGKIEKMKEDFNKEYFTKVDITTIKEIPLKAKKAKIVTTHPSNSYKFCCDDSFDKLVITDYKEFWSTSKYLVIVID